MEKVEARENSLCLSVTDFVDLANQTLEYAYSGVLIEGEVASFKVNQNKYVFFDLKDAETSVSCFMMKYALRFPLSDGMRLRVKALPKLTRWGKFSLTIVNMMPVGEGSIKKSFEELKKKLEQEGLFAQARKRPLREKPTKIGVISSTQAAGYVDFCEILNKRWGGLEVLTAHTQVQGMMAADQIIRALDYFNERNDVEVLVIIRGGGSADDLALFNDEALVRRVAASKIPVLTGIGHEVDESLCDLVADMRAATPTDAAVMLTRDKLAEKQRMRESMRNIEGKLQDKLTQEGIIVRNWAEQLGKTLGQRVETFENEVRNQYKIIEELNPDRVLERGYAMIQGELVKGNVVKITTINKEIKAEIKELGEREVL